MNIDEFIRDINEYVGTHDAYSADTERLGRMIDRVNEELDFLREDEPESLLIDKLEECLSSLQFLMGCAEAATDMGLTDGDDGRDPDNNWF